ncbi:MAG: hypothetical protein PHN56_06450 [Candidatus Nanoarchaeia archaeon]|nr:hypothetical protein [Candidatus Nanoarchaeia archaeon]
MSRIENAEDEKLFAETLPNIEIHFVLLKEMFEDLLKIRNIK